MKKDERKAKGGHRKKRGNGKGRRECEQEREGMKGKGKGGRETEKNEYTRINFVTVCFENL